jgi:hypothetical protein
MEQIHTTSVQPMSQTPQTQAEGGYTCLPVDASANLSDRSDIVLHVPTVNATCTRITIHLTTFIKVKFAKLAVHDKTHSVL